MAREEQKKYTKANEIPDFQETSGKVESHIEEKIEDTMMKLKEKEKEAAENFDKYMRAIADLENYKKRAAKEKAETIKYGNENLLKDILPLADSLDRACRHACNSEDFEAFKAGFKLLQDQLSCCLEKHGVEKIEAVGKDFDPNVHEAMLQVDTEEHEDNKVVDEFEKGYLLNSRLLRPAKVSVSKRTKQKI
ncbi:MAG: nucleotide exchange factor GrpE [Syntrophales bacterium]|nr:nucleotide exchange factor GrpE [Syntrophales bacterium]